MALSRAFLAAGASRLVISLWSVDDRATAELMARFYRRMLGPEHMAPAAALRAAQLEMRAQPRWRSPYFWAGFVLQGEWH
jgi:CHAT domain-containing protein